MKSTSLHIILLIALVVLVSKKGFSQDTIRSTKPVVLSMNAEWSKLNFFHNIQLNTELFKLISLEGSIGVNINKTYFQRSFAPQFSLGMGYDVFRNLERWKLIPMIKARTTMIDLSENTRLSYLEGAVGYSLIFGSKWYFTHGAFLGRGVEFYNSIDSKASYWSYSLNIGFGYGF